MTGKHTPGPWRISYERGTKKIRAADNEILMLDEKYYPWVPENPEDWNLIAAAPDLLKLAELLARIPVGDDMADDVPIFGLNGAYITYGNVREARATIAKARGQE